MRSTTLAVCVAVAMTLTMSSGYGQTEPTQVPPPLVPGGALTSEGVSPTPGTEFTLGPRFWYVFGSFGLPKLTSPPGTLQTATNTGYTYPMGGLVGSARFSSLPDTTFVLSGLYGRTSIPNSILRLNLGSATVDSFQISTHGNRYDLEFLGQTVIPNTSGAWIAGVRWEHSSLGGGQFITTFPQGLTVGQNFTSSVNIYSLKGGLAGAVPLNASGNLSLFGNIMLLVGLVSSTNVSDYGVIGPDMSIGLQYAPSPAISLDVRYRGLFEFTFAKPVNTQTYGINQGPMVSANFKF